MRFTSKPLREADVIRPSVRGSMTSPLLVAGMPCPSWINSGRNATRPMKAMKIRHDDSAAVAKVRLRKSDSVTMGLSTRDSTTSSSTKPTAASASKPSTGRDDQPAVPPQLRASNSGMKVTSSSAAPTKSMRPPVRWVSGGVITRIMKSASAASGRLM